jgi:hypothetical protein
MPRVRKSIQNRSLWLSWQGYGDSTAENTYLVSSHFEKEVSYVHKYFSRRRRLDKYVQIKNIINNTILFGIL